MTDWLTDWHTNRQLYAFGTCALKHNYTPVSIDHIHNHTWTHSLIIVDTADKTTHGHHAITTLMTLPNMLYGKHRGGRTCVIIASYVYIPGIVVHVHYTEKHGWMQVDVVEESSLAIPVAQIDQGPDFVRPDVSLSPGHVIILLTLFLCMRVDTTNAPSSSFVQSLPGHWDRGIDELEGMEWHFLCWHGVSPVGVRLPSVNRWCCCKAMSSKRSAVSHIHSLLPKKKPGVREVNSGKSVDQGLTFLLSKNYLCTIVLTFITDTVWLKLLRIRPSILYVLKTIIWMCVDHERSLEIKIPRSLTKFVAGIMFPFKRYTDGGGPLEGDLRTALFDWLKFIRLVILHW